MAIHSIEHTFCNEEFWAAIVSQIDDFKDLSRMSRLNNWFRKLIDRKYFWEPIQKSLLQKIGSQRQWVYLAQKDKKKSVCHILKNCPTSGDQLIQKIEIFFQFLRGNTQNVMSCLFSDGIEMNIIISPKLGRAPSPQLSYCDCRMKFFELTFERARESSERFERLENRPDGRWRRIFARGGIAVCELIFPKNKHALSEQPTSEPFCQELQNRLLEVILDRLIPSPLTDLSRNANPY